MKVMFTNMINSEMKRGAEYDYKNRTRKHGNG